MAKFQEQDHTSTAPTSDISINNHLTLSSSSLSYSALSRPETRSRNIASPEHIQPFVWATSGSTHLIMDFVSLSPSDDLSDEIRITIHLKPTTFPSPPYPRPRFQWPYSWLGRERVRRAPTSSHPWFASHLVNLSSTSKIIIVRPTTPLCLPVHLLPQQREDEEIPEQKVTVAAVCHSLPTPSTPRSSANTGRTTRRSQRLHAPVSSPDQLSSSIVTDCTMTVATPQKTLNDKWILFHRMDYKAKVSPRASELLPSTPALFGVMSLRTRNTPQRRRSC